MKRLTSKLQYKILVLTIAITVVPLAFLGIISYLVSVRFLEEQVSQSNFNTNRQIADKIDIVFETLDTYSMNIWREETIIESLQRSEDVAENLARDWLLVQQAIKATQVMEGQVYSVYIEGMNGLVFDTSGVKNNIPDELKEELISLRGGGKLISDEVVDYQGNKRQVFSFLRVLKNPVNLSENLGFIKINILETTISKLYQGMLLSDNSMLVITDEDNLILSAKETSLIGTHFSHQYWPDEIATEKAGFFKQKVEGRVSLVTYVGLKYSNWKLVNTIPLNELNRGATRIQQVTFATMMIAILLCFFISYSVSKRIVEPIHRLRDSMKEIDGENFDIDIPVVGNDEVSLLSASYNKMLHKLKELIREVYVMEIKQKEMEIAVLHEQINPHFLYNALNTIYWICRVEEAPESAELVKKLSRLFRLTLNSGELITTVGQEVEHLECYIAIQEKRFDEMVSFFVEVEEGILAEQVIKLILQPLVENAIIHGIEKKGTVGKVSVKVFYEGDYIFYTVEDDGVGVDVKRMTQILENKEGETEGFAVRNVHDRIRIHYGDGFGLSYESEIGKGTKVTVKQPRHERRRRND